MAAGYAGKILKINLKRRSISIIDTEQYIEWVGGHGIGSALFWDFCKDKTIDGFNPQNVITIMSSPLSGTLSPGGAGRTELQGIGIQAYPIGWFTRSNFGGRFGGMLKSAGWDGMVIEDASDTPIWINIINDHVTFEDASKLWGLDTWDTQQVIWQSVTGKSNQGEWLSTIDNTQTTQKPAVLCIGPSGENLSRSAVLIHDIGHAAGQGGFGGIWGAKNLKAISVIGTGDIKIANPKELLDSRLWFQRNYSFDKEGQVGLAGCQGCSKICRRRNLEIGNGLACAGLTWYKIAVSNEEVQPDVYLKVADLTQKYGINAMDLQSYIKKHTVGAYLIELKNMGILGPGNIIDSDPLPFDKLGKLEYAESLIKAISYRQGIGNDLAEGPSRAAKKWGRLEKDLESGILPMAQWGYAWHWSLPGVEWPFGSILGDRDIEEHDFDPSYSTSPGSLGLKLYPEDLTPEQHVELISQKTIPFTGDPLMFNYSWQGSDGNNMADALEKGIYSKHKAKLVAWHRHYTRFWKQSIQYCDWMFSNFTSKQKPHHSGYTPEAEPKFYNAVTGNKLSFAQGMEIGRKIWNLDRAIWILQGRHRDMEVPAAFLFKPGASYPKPYPVFKNNKWHFDTSLADMYLDRNGVESFKTNYYELEGWDTSNGWPGRGTLEDLGLKKVADTLQKVSRLGVSGTYKGNKSL